MVGRLSTLQVSPQRRWAPWPGVGLGLREVSAGGEVQGASPKWPAVCPLHFPLSMVVTVGIGGEQVGGRRCRTRRSRHKRRNSRIQ